MKHIISTAPTIRTVNGCPVHFYSPQQIEQIVAPEKRLPVSKGETFQQHTLFKNQNKRPNEQ